MYFGESWLLPTRGLDDERQSKQYNNIIRNRENFIINSITRTRNQKTSVDVIFFFKIYTYF